MFPVGLHTTGIGSSTRIGVKRMSVILCGSSEPGTKDSCGSRPEQRQRRLLSNLRDQRRSEGLWYDEDPGGFVDWTRSNRLSLRDPSNSDKIGD